MIEIFSSRVQIVVDSNIGVNWDSCVFYVILLIHTEKLDFEGHIVGLALQEHNVTS